MRQERPRRDFEAKTKDIAQRHKILRDAVNTDIPNIAPGFGVDFVALIEQNRRRSKGNVEDFAIEARRNMARRRDARWDIGIFRVPKISTRDRTSTSIRGGSLRWPS
jgi:hypothetical protein